MLSCSSPSPETCKVLFFQSGHCFALASLRREHSSVPNSCLSLSPPGPACLSGEFLGALLGLLCLGSVVSPASPAAPTRVSSPALVPPAGPDLGLRAGALLPATEYELPLPPSHTGSKGCAFWVVCVCIFLCLIEPFSSAVTEPVSKSSLPLPACCS